MIHVPHPIQDSARNPKFPLHFWRSQDGVEPVRDWLRNLPEQDRRLVGMDLMRVQYRWPVGMPLCRPMGKGLWEVRSDLGGNRTSRVLFCHADGKLVALHAFIKKTRATPVADLQRARQRMKGL